MAMRTRKKPTKLAKANSPKNQKAPLSAHLRELKRRLIYVAVSIAAWSSVAYGVERKLIDVLLRPSEGQHFVYTSPMGGVNFLFSVCIFFGIVLSIPAIIYNLLKFLQPLMKDTTTKFIFGASATSAVVAICGVLFGYFAGLPAALHFLLRQQFHGGQVEALITIQSYFSFVTAYMVGAAIMFQLPLILVIINRIRPLKPKQMFKAERAVIIFAFIAAFIMNPTPNVIDQMFVVIPIIFMYQLGIGLVWYINRRNGRIKYHHLFEQDASVQAERQAQATSARPLRVLPNAAAPVLTQRAQSLATSTEVAMSPVVATSTAPQSPRSFTTTHSISTRASYPSLSSRLIQ